MYSQQQQQQQQQQQRQQAPSHYQIIEPSNTNYAKAPTSSYFNPIKTTSNHPYNQLQRPPPPPPHQQPYHQQPPSQHHAIQHGYGVVPPEPVPSATDAQPTPPLSIPQLADFASSMVYLMWHARRPSVMQLHELSKLIQSTGNAGDQNLTHSKETAIIANRTSSAFRKFCKQILTATQLSESVILLSLKYIAMLLQNSPSIHGADGSEYRLFTVALMLANKFLDDNTFTNKTWSEVSGMKVTDLNIMELEFLDVLRFKMFIKNDEYERWKSALFLLRNQLMNADELQKQENQQKLLEETLKGIVLPNSHIQQQQQQQQQDQYQFLLMLSKAQLPQFPTQPLNRPLTRVPLRIPLQPVWRNQQYDYGQTSAATSTNTTTTNTTTNTSNYPSQAKTTDIYYTPTSANPTMYMANPSQQQQQPQQSFPTPQQSLPQPPSSAQMPLSIHPPVTTYQPPAQTTRISLQDYNGPNTPNTNMIHNTTHNAETIPYYKLTPTTATTTTTPTSQPIYNNKNPYNPTPPPLRTRTSFYGEPATSYDGSSNDYYSRVQPAGYHPQYHSQTQQTYRPNHPPAKTAYKYNRPMPEDPLTAAESYRSHLK